MWNSDWNLFGMILVVVRALEAAASLSSLLAQLVWPTTNPNCATLACVCLCSISAHLTWTKTFKTFKTWPFWADSDKPNLPFSVPILSVSCLPYPILALASPLSSCVETFYFSSSLQYHPGGLKTKYFCEKTEIFCLKWQQNYTIITLLSTNEESYKRITILCGVTYPAFPPYPKFPTCWP